MLPKNMVEIRNIKKKHKFRIRFSIVHLELYYPHFIRMQNKILTF